jgi:predicted aspartyl protease
MRKKLGTFQHTVELISADGETDEDVSPWVDTGALCSQFPGDLLRALGHNPNASRILQLADESTMERPVGSVPVRIRGETQHVLCIFAEEGDAMLLGATALETFSLATDPVNKTLTPVVPMQLCISEEGAS